MILLVKVNSIPDFGGGIFFDSIQAFYGKFTQSFRAGFF